MPNIVALFLTPVGRIRRLTFWLGVLATLVVTTGLLFAFDPTIASGVPPPTPPLINTILGIISFWPFTVLGVKRFNDRNYPNWVGWLVGASMITITVANHFGYLDFVNWAACSPVEKVLLAGIGVLWLFSLVDNGFLRGTKGDNRYGPDPLAQ